MDNDIRRDIQISDVALSLVPGDDALLFQPLLYGLNVRLTEEAVRKLAEQAVVMANTKSPVEIQLSRCQLISGGVALTARAGKGFMGTDVSVNLMISAANNDEIRIRLGNVDAPRWLPIASLVEKVIEKVVVLPGIQADIQSQGVLVNPTELLAAQGWPIRLAPGSWDVVASPSDIVLTYRDDGEGS